VFRLASEETRRRQVFEQRKNEKTIAFVVYQGVMPLDLVGAHMVLATLGLRSRYRTVVVGARVEPLDVDAPLKLVPTKTFDEVPQPFAVIVPGGGVSTLAAMANDAVRDYLRATADTAEVIGSIGTGALILAAAGLLRGRQATTRWAYRGLLENLGARYIQQRWVQDGKFMTAAGVSGGIDMALSLVGTLCGESSERWAQLLIEYDPQPPFGGIDWSGIGSGAPAPLSAQQQKQIEEALAARPDLVRAVEGWITPAAAR
jgi:transcriptional regulator GlxA family with amidase domain